MNLESISERLDVTRGRIESTIGFGGVVTVASALSDDGTALLAKSLSLNMAAVGHNVLLVDAREIAKPEGNASTRGEKLAVPSVWRAGKTDPALFDFATFSYASGSQVNAIRAALSHFRESFDYTIVATSTGSGAALTCATSSDGVLVAFRDGRAASPADRELVRDLNAAKVDVLGVVTLNAREIRRFANQPFEAFGKLEQIRPAMAREVARNPEDVLLFASKVSG